MIQRVFLYFIMPMMFVAFFLALLGVQQVTLGDSYYRFLSSVNNSFAHWSFKIPDIPQITKLDVTSFDSSGEILKVLIKIANAFFGFVNVITRILNIFILVINVVIQVVQFILTVIYRAKDFINRTANAVVAYV